MRRLICLALTVTVFAPGLGHADEVCAQRSVEPTAPSGVLSYPAGGGLSISRDGLSAMIGQGVFDPYVLRRTSVPNPGWQTESLVLSSGQAFPLRAHSVAEDFDHLALEADDAQVVDPGDDNGYTDIYVAQWSTNSFQRISVGSSGSDANGDSFNAVISPTGTKVAFVSWSTNLVPDAPGRGIYLWDSGSSQLELVKNGDGSALTCPNHEHLIVREFSRDGGSFLVFCNVGPAPTELWMVDATAAVAVLLDVPFERFGLLGVDDVFQTFLVSSWPLEFSREQVFSWNRLNGQRALVSARDVGGEPDASASGASLSGDGSFASFSTRATNVLGTENGDFPRTYVRDLRTGELAAVNGDAFGVPRGAVGAFLSRDGSRLHAYSSWPKLSSAHDESHFSSFLIGNPLLCERELWQDSFEP